MTQQLTDKVSFDLIRYANCWEDADVLLEALAPQPGSRILSIGSAGDNSFSLLTCDPEVVVAVDVNRIQLHLIELKKAAIQLLDYEELLGFLGFRETAEREALFNRIKSALPEEARLYWEQHPEQIRKGIITQGKFEKYFQLFTGKILPWIHSQKRVEALLQPKSAAEQEAFYHRHWNTWRWRLLFKVFFSKYIMGKYGRDPEFLKEVTVNVGQTIFNKAATHLQSTGAQHNFILRYNLTGSFGHLLPHYLQPENLAVIKANLHKLEIREGYAEAAVAEFGTFHAMNLSNIFEYMPPQLFAETAEKLASSMEKGGRIAYWNLMVPRSVANIFPEKATHLAALSETLSARDKGFFYKGLIVDEIR